MSDFRRAVEEGFDRAYDPVDGLAARAGIDTSVCEFCEEPLDDSEPWKRGLDGCGAHLRCLKPFLESDL